MAFIGNVSDVRIINDELNAFLRSEEANSGMDYTSIKPTHKTRVDSFAIPDKVITSGPCTHVFCRGRKLATVRKSEGDRWNAEKGFAMAICKATYDKETFEDLIKYAGKETVIAFAKYAMTIPGYLELRRNGWKQYK